MSRPTSVNNQFPHAGFAAYFERSASQDRGVAERLAELLVDKRWPWIPWWAEFSGIHKRDDQPAVRVGGKNGGSPIMEGLLSQRFARLRMNRSMGDKDFTSVNLNFDPARVHLGDEAPYRILMTCRYAELPEGKSFKDWIALSHDITVSVGALNAIVGAWPTYDLAIGDTWLTRVILDTTKGDIPLNDPPGEFMTQRELLKKWSHKLGRTYARHPRWGTYLNAAHVAAIGGVERIRAEVQPARIDPVGNLTYIQLTDSIETGMSPEAGERRRKLQLLMEPILLGAGQPPRPAEG